MVELRRGLANLGLYSIPWRGPRNVSVPRSTAPRRTPGPRISLPQACHIVCYKRRKTVKIDIRIHGKCIIECVIKVYDGSEQL